MHPVFRDSCSSQEEHVLKHRPDAELLEAVKLLLARGACIETLAPYTLIRLRVLLLARGACIETYPLNVNVPTLEVAPRKRSMY